MPEQTPAPQTQTNESPQQTDGSRIANKQALLLVGGVGLGAVTLGAVAAEGFGAIDVIPGFGLPHQQSTQGGEPTVIPGAQSETPTVTPTPTGTLAATLDGSGPATAVVDLSACNMNPQQPGCPGAEVTPSPETIPATAVPAEQTVVPAEPTLTIPASPEPSPTVAPEKPEFAGCTINPDGSVNVPQASLDFMDNLKINGFDVMDITQWAGDGTIVGDEVTAGTRQNVVKMDLWQPDDGSVEINKKAPWGNAEVSTFLYEQDFTENPQSVAHNTPFKGKLWAYPHNNDGTQGWTIEQAQCDAARATTERLAAPGGFENIGDVMVVPLGNTGTFILVHSDGSPWTNPDGALTWSGTIDPRDNGIVGMRGILPLQVFIDLQLVTPRY